MAGVDSKLSKRDDRSLDPAAFDCAPSVQDLNKLIDRAQALRHVQTIQTKIQSLIVI